MYVALLIINWKGLKVSSTTSICQNSSQSKGLVICISFSFKKVCREILWKGRNRIRQKFLPICNRTTFFNKHSKKLNFCLCNRPYYIWIDKKCPNWNFFCLLTFTICCTSYITQFGWFSLDKYSNWSVF